jgi:hypothetical protein
MPLAKRIRRPYFPQSAAGWIDGRVQFVGQKTRKKAMRMVILVTALLMVLGFCFCGSSSDQNSQCFDYCDPLIFTVGLSPASTSIPILGSVAITGKTNNFNDKGARWWVDESRTQNRLDCAYTSLSQSSFDHCPFGYVIYSAAQPPYSATYYASTVAGTYHVGFAADPDDGSGPRQTFAVVTVTPK